MAINIKLKYRVMVATHYEKINTHLFLHAPLGFVSFKPKKNKKKNFGCSRHVSLLFCWLPVFPLTSFCIVIGITFNEHVICNRLTHCDFWLSGNASWANSSRKQLPCAFFFFFFKSPCSNFTMCSGQLALMRLNRFCLLVQNACEFFVMLGHIYHVARC